MTFSSAPLAIDGALIGSAMLRRGIYTSTGGSQGIVNNGDLKVTTLAVPGVGIRIASGVGLVLNGYQTLANETYVVANPSIHTIPSDSMPPSNPSPKSYIVAITVGDPEFSQVGHPWMASDDPPPGTEDSFVYVRPWLIEVSPGATELSGAYPALPLARIDVPGSTTTITSGMITDLRELAQPRSKTESNHASASGENILNGAGGVYTAWERWPAVDILTCRVPAWAKEAKVSGFVEGAILTKAGSAVIRIAIKDEGISSPATNINENLEGSNDRRGYSMGGVLDVTSVAGEIVTFIVEGHPSTDPSKGALKTSTATSAMIQAIFEEDPS